MNILKMGIASGKLSGTKPSTSTSSGLKIMNGASAIIKGRPVK